MQGQHHPKRHSKHKTTPFFALGLPSRTTTFVEPEGVLEKTSRLLKIY
jgi:hypothetical protein